MDNKEVKVDYGRELNLRPPEEVSAMGQSRKRKEDLELLSGLNRGHSK